MTDDPDDPDDPFTREDRAYAARLVLGRLTGDPDLYRLALAELLDHPTPQGGVDIRPFITVVDLITLQLAQLLDQGDRDHALRELRARITESL